MRLNHDNVRSLLLFIEDSENGSSRSQAELSDFSEKKDIPEEEIIYMIERLKEANFIDAQVVYASDQVYWFSVSSITWKGHEYIDTIRDSRVWTESKRKASEMTSVSLATMAQIATTVIANTIF